MRFFDWLFCKIVQVCSWMAQVTGGWAGLSKIWRFTHEERDKDYQLRKIETLPELEYLLSKGIYEPDTKRFGDSISYPGAIQRRYDWGKPIGDCDDFAVLAAAYIAGPLCPMMPSANPFLLSVHWTKDFQLLGHAVCVFQWKGGFWTIGNWYRRKAIGPFKSVEEVARKIAKDGQGRICTYAGFEWKSLKNKFFRVVN